MRMPRGAARPGDDGDGEGLESEHGAELRLGQGQRHHQEAGEAGERGRRRVGHRLHAARIDAHQAAHLAAMRDRAERLAEQRPAVEQIEARRR